MDSVTFCVCVLVFFMQKGLAFKSWVRVGRTLMNSSDAQSCCTCKPKFMCAGELRFSRGRASSFLGALVEWKHMHVISWYKGCRHRVGVAESECLGDAPPPLPPASQTSGWLNSDEPWSLPKRLPSFRWCMRPLDCPDVASWSLIIFQRKSSMFTLLKANGWSRCFKLKWL